MTSIEIKLEPKDLESSNQICRLCLSEESLESVFKEENLPQWISEFLSIVITAEDRLSQATCAICRIRLTEFHQYRMRCHEVQEVLQSMVQQDDDALTIEKADHQISSDPINDSETVAPVPKNGEGKPKIQCEVCNKVFIVRQQLTSHRKIHRPKHKCTRCNKSFVIRQRWVQHMKKHKKMKKLTQEKEDQDESPTIEKEFHKLLEVKTDPPEEDSSFPKRTDQGVELESANETGQTNFSDDEDSIPLVVYIQNLQGKDTDPVQSSSLEEHLRTEDNDERYACSKCNRTFNRECQLKNHMKVHDALAEKLQSSDIDDDVEDEDAGNMIEEDESDYSEGSSVKYGVEDAHDGKQQLQCNKCNKVFHPLETQKLSDHKRQVHGPKNHRCSICEKPFAIRWNMLKHLKTHQATWRRNVNRRKKEDGIDSPFKCATCPKSFMAKVSLKKHVKYAHGPKIHECHICGYRFSIRGSLDIHIKRHTRYRDSKEDFKSFKQAHPKEASTKFDGDKSVKETNLGPEEDGNLNSAASSHVEKKPLDTTSECGKCNKVFQNQKALWFHYKYSHGTRQKCSICNVVFLSTIRFSRHMLTKHQKADDSDTTLKCEKCNKVYSSQKSLRAHMKTHGPRCHRCKLCPQTYSTPFLLKKHMKCHEHVGDGLMIPARLRKGFECTICHKVIGLPKMMQAHIRKEHGSQLHECSICRKLFLKREDMELHVKSHSSPEQMEGQVSVDLREDVKPSKELEKIEISPEENAANEVTTEVCNGTSTTTQQSHRSGSELARKFECEVCHKRFLTRIHLNGHIRKSHEPKTCLCSLCGKGFISSFYLKRHQFSQRSCNEPRSCEICKKSFPTWRTCAHLRRNSQRNEENSLDLVKTDLVNHSKTSALKNPSRDKQTDQSSDSGKSQVTGKIQTLKNRESQNVKKRRSKGTLHSCSQCTSQFTSKMQLKEHMKSSHHQENASSSATQPETEQAQAIDRTADLPVVNAVLLFEAEEFKIELE